MEKTPRDLFDFLKEDATEPRYQHRGVDVVDGQPITYDDRGFCPGSCACMHCAAARVRVKRANRAAALKVKA